MCTRRVVHRSALGSGLAIVSRLPIVKVAFHRFSLNGNPLRIFDGDWFVGKGVGYAQLQHPKGRLDVFTTHLIADYSTPARPGNKGKRDEYRVQRALQMYETLEFVTRQRHPDSIGTILVGDFNAEMSAVAWQAFVDGQDVLQSIFGSLPARDIPCTCNCPLNQYSPPGATAKTIDHILYDWRRLRLTRFDLAFTAEVPDPIKGGCRGANCPRAFSDHFGVSALFTLLDPGESPGSRGHDERAVPRRPKATYGALARLRAEIVEEQMLVQDRRRMTMLQMVVLAGILLGTVGASIFIVSTPTASASPPMYILLGLLPVVTLTLGLNLIIYLLHYPNERAALGQFLIQLSYYSRAHE